MYRLYTSNTCPKGVAAREFLAARRAEFQEVNLDVNADAALEANLRWLSRAALRSDQADISLPTLTAVAAEGNESIAAIGFDPARWEEILGVNA